MFSLNWWLICFATFAMMFIRGGDGSILIYLGACGWIVQRNPGFAWRTLLDYWPLLLLPAFCMFSTIWSDRPSVSLKQSAELIATCVLAIVVCRRIEGRELAAALLFSSFLICLLSLAYQRNGLSRPLVGLMGSKNQMAFLGQILMASAAAVVVEAKNSRPLRLFAMSAFALGLMVMLFAQSAGALVTSVAALATFAGLSLFSRVSFGIRVVFVILAVLVIAPLAVAYQDVIQVAQTIQTQVLHKDSTLTGRTQLWDTAKTVIAQSPIFGHGYSAFWQQGNPDAEAIWQIFGIGSRGGFNFHNQFLDAQVDLGKVGLGVMLITLLYVGVGSVWRVMTNPSLSAAFMTTLLITIYSRLPVESTLVGPWNLYTFIWMGVGVSAYAGNNQTTRVVERSMPQGRARPAWRSGQARPRVAPERAPHPDPAL